MSPRRTQPATAAVLRAMLQMRLQEMSTGGSILRLALTFALVFGLLSLALNEQDSVKFWNLVVGTFVLKFLPLFCLTKGGETLRGELKDGTIEYLWTRPASKTQLYCGFFASSLLNIGSFGVAFLLGISFAGLSLGVITGLGQIVLLWVGAGIAIVSFTAIAGAFSAFSSKFVVLGIFYFSFVELGLSQIPTSIRNVSISAHISRILSPLTEAAPSGFGAALLWSGAITAVALAVGVALFNGIRYGVGSEKEA